MMPHGKRKAHVVHGSHEAYAIPVPPRCGR